MDISAIEGEELTSVTYFQEYVQLDFNGPELTLFIWPEVFVSTGMQIGEGSYAYREPGYRDAMCLQIGESVEATTVEEGSVLEIQFENGTIFRVSLREEDYEGPEAAHFRSGLDGDDLEVI